MTSAPSSSVLVLHGNRQSGQLFLGRIERLEKRFRKDFQLDLVAPDAPFPNPDDRTLQTWWDRAGDDYLGLDETLAMLRQLQDRHNFVGILGFSQGARLCHLLAVLHTNDPHRWFPNLRFVIMMAGYDAPIPPQLRPLLNDTNDRAREGRLLPIPSLHVWGEGDSLVLPQESEAVTKEYREPRRYIHPGNHFVPTKAADMQVYSDFVQQSLSGGELPIQDHDDGLLSVTDRQEPTPPRKESTDSLLAAVSTAHSGSPHSTFGAKHSADAALDENHAPDNEAFSMQQEEVQALEAIFPDELELKSSKQTRDDEDVFVYPIIYHLKLFPSDEEDGKSFR
jgi:pimeloyl-ACP methyl ester carboxylesterase